MAGGCSSRLWRPGGGQRRLDPSMIRRSTPAPAAGGTWRARPLAEHAIRSPKSSPRISSGRLPAAIAGVITSETHMADSVSAIRRRLSPWARIVCWMAAGRNPAWSCASIVDVRELIVAHAVVRIRRGGARRLADERQQLDRDAGPLGELANVDAAERREPLERRHRGSRGRPGRCGSASPRPSSGIPRPSGP